MANFDAILHLNQIRPHVAPGYVVNIGPSLNMHTNALHTNALLKTYAFRASVKCISMSTKPVREYSTIEVFIVRQCAHIKQGLT